MADADDLLAEFISADRGGSTPDPLAFLARVDESQHAQLEEQLDAYLAAAPRRPFDAAAFAASGARPITDDVARVVLGAAGSWPSVLPALRHRAHLRRADLVARLATALGASGHEAKVGAYYHQMEQGSLPAAGVSQRVLAALGEIVGESAERLRTAGRVLGLDAAGRPSAPAMPAAFARVAQPNEQFAAGVAASASGVPDAPARDFVDELFTGGASET